MFIDDLQEYQENHEQLSATSERDDDTSKYTGAGYGMKKCAKIVYCTDKIVKREGLDGLGEKMLTEKNEVYKFIVCEQGIRWMKCK